MTERPIVLSRSGRARRRIALAAALVPLVWSVVAHAGGSKPAALTIAPPAPSLSYTQYLVDKGEVKPTAEEDAMFGFVNRGSEPVLITKIKASCGCLQPRVICGEQVFRPGEDDKLLLPIPPGEQGMIQLRVQMANQEPGQKEYTVTVDTRGVGKEQSEQTVLAFRMAIPASVEVQPRSMVVYQRGGTINKEQEIVVTDMRPVPFRVLGASCESDLVELRLEKTTANENGHRRTVVKLAFVETAPPGKNVAVVQIFTDDPDYAVVRVPLWIYGPQEENPQISSGDDSAIK